jgi:hypothetical protein
MPKIDSSIEGLLHKAAMLDKLVSFLKRKHPEVYRAFFHIKRERKSEYALENYYKAMHVYDKKTISILERYEVGAFSDNPEWDAISILAEKLISEAGRNYD